MIIKHSAKKSVFIKLFAMILCIGMVFSLTNHTVYAEETIESAKKKKEELSSKKNDLKGQLSELESDAAKKEEYQKTLEDQIDVVLDEIRNTETEIELLDEQIADLEEKMRQAEAEMGDTINLFHQRIIAIYMSGGNSQMGTLEVLLNAESLHDFTLKSQMIETVNEHDGLIVERIEKYLKDTEADRNALKEAQESLALTKKALDTQKAELSHYLAENEKALNEVISQKLAAADQIQNLERDEDEIQRQINELIEAEKKRQEEEAARKAEEAKNAANSGGNDDDYTAPPSGGTNTSSSGWVWPLQGAPTVTSHYGGRWGTTHRGIDISSGGNYNVVASRSGTVIDAIRNAEDYKYTGGMWQFGYYVTIYHDGEFTTRYAHMSKVFVSKGDYVEAGQVLGIEGKTGQVTGTHLHFEVHRYGERIDPWPYIKGARP